MLCGLVRGRAPLVQVAKVIDYSKPRARKGLSDSVGGVDASELGDPGESVVAAQYEGGMAGSRDEENEKLDSGGDGKGEEGKVESSGNGEGGRVAQEAPPVAPIEVCRQLVGVWGQVPHVWRPLSAAVLTATIAHPYPNKQRGPHPESPET